MKAGTRPARARRGVRAPESLPASITEQHQAERIAITAKGQAELDGRDRALLLKAFKRAIDRLDAKVVRQLVRVVLEAGLGS